MRKLSVRKLMQTLYHAACLLLTGLALLVGGQAMAQPLRVPQEYATIQAAIDAAAAGQEVWVSGGTYAEQLTLRNGIALYGGFAGGETTREQRDFQTHRTIIRPALDKPVGLPAGEYYSPVMVTMDGLSSATLDGFVLTLPSQINGVEALDKLTAVAVLNASVTNRIAHCEFSGFTVASGNWWTDISLIRVQAGCATIDACTFLQNTCGSLIAVEQVAAETTVTDCSFTANGSGYIGSANGGSMNWVRCTLSNNSATGVFSVGSTLLRLTDCALTSLTAGIECAGPLVVDRCSIVNCREGGILRNSGAGGCRVTNAVLAGHQKNGLALYGTTATLTNCTVADNGENGVLLSTPGAVRVINSILSGNGGYGLKSANDFGGVDDALDHCLFFENAQGAFTSTNWSGLANVGLVNQLVGGAQGNVSGAPLFVNEAARNYQLSDGSVAVDRGGVNLAPPVDLAGTARPGGDQLVDIGAYEAPASYLAGALQSQPQSNVVALSNVTTSATLPLHYQVSDASGCTDSFKAVRLFYRKDRGTWTQWGGDFSPLGGQVALDTTALGGDGYYEFYSIAVANNDALEAAPAAADAATLVLAATRLSRIYVNPGGTLEPTGHDWARGLHDLYDGVLAARAVGADEIWCVGGSYSFPPDIEIQHTLEIQHDLGLIGGFAGNETTPAERQIENHPTVIDSDITLYCHDFGRVKLDGLTLRHIAFWLNDLAGYTDIRNVTLLDKATVTMNRVLGRIENCSFSVGSSGFACDDSTVTVARSRFVADTSGSTPFQQRTRAVRCGNSRLDLDRVSFAQHALFEESGAAIQCSGSTVSLQACSIDDCRVGSPLAGSDRHAAKGTGLVPPTPPPAPEPVAGSAIQASSSTLRMANCRITGNASGWTQYYVLGEAPGQWTDLPPRPAKGGAVYVEGTQLFVTNCTFDGNVIELPTERTGETPGGGAITATAHSQVALVNTIFSGNNESAVVTTGGSSLDLSYVLTYANAQGDVNFAGVAGAGTITSDPRYVNAAAGDYQLASDSPAIDSGRFIAGTSVDLAGTLRPVVTINESRGDGSHFDIGAYEYGLDFKGNPAGRSSVQPAAWSLFQ